MLKFLFCWNFNSLLGLEMFQKSVRSFFNKTLWIHRIFFDERFFFNYSYVKILNEFSYFTTVRYRSEFRSNRALIGSGQRYALGYLPLSNQELLENESRFEP